MSRSLLKQGNNLVSVIPLARLAIFYLSLVYISYRASMVISGVVSQGVTLGAIGRMVVFCLAVAMMLLIIENIRFEHVKKLLTFPRLQKFNFLVFILASCLTAPSLINICQGLSPLVLMIAIMLVELAIFSVYLTLSGKLFQALLIFIACLPFLRFFEWEAGRACQWDIGFGVVTPTIVYLVSIFVSYLMANREREHLKLSGIQAATLSLFIFYVLSVFISSNMSHSVELFLPQILFPLIFFYLMLKALQDVGQAKVLLYTLTIIGILYVFFGFYDLIGMTIPTPDKLLSLYGEMGFARQFKIIATILLPFTLAMALYETGRKRFCLVVSIFVELVLIVATFSRIALLAALFSFVPFLRNKWAFSAIFIIILLVTCFQGWLMDNVLVRFQDIVKAGSLEMFYWSPMRWWGIKGGFSIIRDYPLFGVGYGMWDDYYYKYGPQMYMGKGMGYIRAAHNTFLDTAVQGGVFLLAALIGFLCVLCKGALSLISSKCSKFNSYMGSAFLGLFLSIIIISFAGNVFCFATENDLTFGIMFWSLVAILAMLSTKDKRPEKGNDQC